MKEEVDRYVNIVVTTTFSIILCTFIGPSGSNTSASYIYRVTCAGLSVHAPGKWSVLLVHIIRTLYCVVGNFGKTRWMMKLKRNHE